MTKEEELLRLMQEVKKMITKDMEETDKFKKTIEKIKKIRKLLTDK